MPDDVSDDAATDPQQQLIDDPYPLYDQWRAADPVLWIGDIQHWFITGHQQAMAALRHPALTGRPLAAGRHRDALRTTFTADLVERFRPRFTDLAAALLGKAAEQGSQDLIGDFASPLAIAMVAGLLGLPSQAEEPLRDWVLELSPTLLPSMGHCGREPGSEPVAAPAEIRGLLFDAVTDRRAEPGDDLISRLLELDEGELLEVCAELVVSGHDSSTALIGNAVAALLDNPGQLARLAAQPGLAPSAVEEFLRYDAPIQLIARSPAEDLDLCGKNIMADEPVLIFLGAANRDPEAFENPADLNLARTPNHHLSFGRGAGPCLGAPLARMAARIAIETLASGYPGVMSSGAPTRRIATGSREFLAFPMVLRS